MLANMSYKYWPEQAKADTSVGLELGSTPLRVLCRFWSGFPFKIAMRFKNSVPFTGCDWGFIALLLLLLMYCICISEGFARAL